MTTFSPDEITDILKQYPGIDARSCVRKLFAPVLGGSASREDRQQLELLLNDSEYIMQRMQQWGLARCEELEDGATGWFAAAE